MATLVVGLDEVGRGCWAGPVVAGAVLLEKPIEGLRDSKKLSKKRREALAEVIRNEAKAYGVGWVTANEVDEMGLTKAVQLAMLRAMKRLQESGETYDEIIIDGNINYFQGVQGLTFRHPTPDPESVTGRTCHRVRAVVKADDSVPAVSAASILAKVARDEYMARLANEFPAYGFETHVGYGTQAHVRALKEHGVTNEHRKSYKPIQAILST